MQDPPADQVDEALWQALHDETLFKFLYLAKFVVGKGHDWLVRGMAPVLRNHSHARLVLAGADRGLMGQIKRQAAKLGIAEQVIFPGHVKRDSVPWLAAHCQVGIVPSVSETFGRNYLEPWRAGIPVIGTRAGIAEWFLQDYLTGIGFLHGDEGELARAAEFMIAHPEDAEQMGRNARGMAQLLFSWPRSVSCNLRLYKALLERDA
jgi:glycosyltransferase involved in cell wall biosynthesis